MIVQSYFTRRIDSEPIVAFGNRVPLITERRCRSTCFILQLPGVLVVEVVDVVAAFGETCGIGAPEIARQAIKNN